MVLSDPAAVPLAGRGKYWQELQVGEKVRTYRRTITETDLVNFISVTGMLEVIFIDTTYPGAVAGRIVPAALTYGMIEGFIFQSQIQGVGLALLSVAIEARAPACVGDTIWATVETVGIKPTSKGNRAIVDSAVTVYNQADTVILTYSVRRMLAGDPAL
jgi:acyl dehydratase